MAKARTIKRLPPCTICDGLRYRLEERYSKLYHAMHTVAIRCSCAGGALNLPVAPDFKRLAAGDVPASIN